MYLDAMEFLEEERDAWAPFEALAGLTDAQLSAPVAAAHDWSGRDLMAHLLAWQEVALRAAKDLAVNDTSETFARVSADWDARGGEVVNAEIEAAWADLPMTEVRDRFATQPGELRGYLTVVPETRWLKHAKNLESFREETMEHYEEHADDLAAILAAAARS
jgi:Mycothiol maleylpyruvate isomerase N-terminal domain